MNAFTGITNARIISKTPISNIITQHLPIALNSAIIHKTKAGTQKTHQHHAYADTDSIV